MMKKGFMIMAAVTAAALSFGIQAHAQYFDTEEIVEEFENKKYQGKSFAEDDIIAYFTMKENASDQNQRK